MVISLKRFSRFRKFFPFIPFLVTSLSFFSLWFLAFNPGNMSADSVDQWYQAQTMRLMNDHPYLHTLYFKLFQIVFNSPALVSIFQILVTATLFSYIFHYFWKNGVNKLLILVLFGLFITSIPVGMYNVTLWKDIPFSLGVVALAFFLSTRYLKDSFSKIDLSVLLFLSWVGIFFRLNGVVYIALLPLLIFIYFRKEKYKYFYLVGLLVIFCFFEFVLPKVLHVKPTPSWLADSYIYHSTVGFYVYQPEGRVTQTTADLLGQFASPSALKLKYSPTSTNSLYNFGGIDPKLYDAPKVLDLPDSRDYWLKLEKDFPINVINNLDFYIGDNTTMFLSSTLGYCYKYIYFVPSENSFGIPTGLGQNTLSTVWYRRFMHVLSLSETNVFLQLLVWNSLVPLLILTALFVDSIYRKKYYFQIFAATILIQVPFLFVFSPSNQWRYFYFLYLTLFISIPLYLLKPKNRLIAK